MQFVSSSESRFIAWKAKGSGFDEREQTDIIYIMNLLVDEPGSKSFFMSRLKRRTCAFFFNSSY